MKAYSFILLLLWGLPLLAQPDSAVMEDPETLIVRLKAEQEALGERIQVLVWRNEDLLAAIYTLQVRNKQMSQYAHSATRLHIGQNLKEIRLYEAMIGKNNQELEQIWNSKLDLNNKIASLQSRIVLKN